MRLNLRTGLLHIEIDYPPRRRAWWALLSASNSPEQLVINVHIPSQSPLPFHILHLLHHLNGDLRTIHNINSLVLK